MFSDTREKLKKNLLLVIGKLLRTKDFSSGDPVETSADNKLKKCLSTLDLTSLGVGSCVGTGMYLVVGMVARNVAGPGIILSFIIAAVASLFSGVCYAEFGVRVPHTTGSAYMYSYVTVGEFIAFVIGWNMILEYLIGTAAVSCALSACIDALCSGAISKIMKTNIGTMLGHTPDVLAASITILMTALMVAGVKKSLLFNNVLNTLNFAVWVFVMGAGLFYVDTSNWTEHGGFMPYGWSGVLAGAATCFYAFIGFDIIATTGEEAKNPKKSLPHAIIVSLLIILTAYITSSAIVTLAVPYDQLNAESALVEIFQQRGATNSKLIVAIGALAGLIASMIGSMFPMPRIVYAMAKDGLIFRSLARVWSLTGTPAVATCILGLFTAVVALVVSLEVLVEMMSIGTLMAYTLVSSCVLILRYQPQTTTLVELLPQSIRSACPTPSRDFPSPFNGYQKTVHAKRTNRVESSDSEDSLGNLPDPTSSALYNRVQGDRDHLVDNNSSNPISHYGSSDILTSEPGALKSKLKRWIIEKHDKFMTRLFPYDWTVRKPASSDSGMFVMKIVGLLYLFIVTLDLIVVYAMAPLESGSPVAVFFFVACLLGITSCLITITLQPQNRCDLKFKAPGVPFVPAIAVIINIYLILKLSILTLVRFVIWMVLGLLMYFLYGIQNSNLESLPIPSSFEIMIPDHRREKASQSTNVTTTSSGTCFPETETILSSNECLKLPQGVTKGLQNGSKMNNSTESTYVGHTITFRWDVFD
ncbi:putative cationic amino acid transporter [Tachypleus tridentatus]|uniref:putative cationic amino acid transporter n=1 Tax=Tachypleus tridentatus TaxID=6853 RepID=UPI003FD60572